RPLQLRPRRIFAKRLHASPPQHLPFFGGQRQRHSRSRKPSINHKRTLERLYYFSHGCVPCCPPVLRWPVSCPFRSHVDPRRLEPASGLLVLFTNDPSLPGGPYPPPSIPSKRAKERLPPPPATTTP